MFSRNAISSSADFVPVIFGPDVLGYSYARQFWDSYHVRSIVVGTANVKFTSTSSLTDYRIFPDTTEKGMLDYLENSLIPECRKAGKKVVLGSSGDWYASLFSRNKERLEELGCAVQYIDYSLFSHITSKEKFYSLCQKLNIPYPKTWLFPCSDDLPEVEGLPTITDDVIESQKYPMIAKPSDSARWHWSNVPNKEKVYIVPSPQAMKALLAQVHASSFNRYLLIQQMLSPVDTSLHSVTVFCRHGKVVMGCVGHVLVQDHSPLALGNPLVIMGEKRPDLLKWAAQFCEEVGYEGYGNFDVMDDENGNPHFLEINARPGRNTFYVSLAGCPFVVPIVDTFVHGKDVNETLTASQKAADNRFLFSILPKGVVRRQIADPALRDQAMQLFAEGKAVSPLINPEDNWHQRMYALANRENYRRKFAQLRREQARER
jgi:D-aspartate ligase